MGFNEDLRLKNYIHYFPHNNYLIKESGTKALFYPRDIPKEWWDFYVVAVYEERRPKNKIFIISEG